MIAKLKSECGQQFTSKMEVTSLSQSLVLLYLWWNIEGFLSSPVCGYSFLSCIGIDTYVDVTVDIDAYIDVVDAAQVESDDYLSPPTTLCYLMEATPTLYLP